MDHRGVYIKGNERFAQGRYDQALSYFLSIVDSNIKDENLLLKISQCYEQLGNYDDAIDFLTRLLDVSISKDDYKKAIAICKRILTLDPDDTEVVLKLANIFRTIKQYGEATYYYKIVAQHYEYAGFMDKALQILQIIKELGQDGVEDLLEMVKDEYKRGAKAKADKNIDEIVVELKNGGEYKLLEVALNLALSNSCDRITYVLELADLYFKTARLESCIRLCLWALNLDKRSSRAFIILTKALWANGWDDYARRLTELIISGELETDSKDTYKMANRIREAMLVMEKEKTIKLSETPTDDEERLGTGLTYLKSHDFTNVDENDVKRKIMMEELEQKVEEAQNERTSIIDIKRKSKFPQPMLEGLKETEVLVSEGMYDKAGLKLFELLEKYPGNEDIKEALNKVLKLSSVADSMPSYSGSELEKDARTTKQMVEDLERYLDQDPNIGHQEYDYQEEQEKIKRVVQMFNGKLNKIVKPTDYQTIFDLGIAYMEMELWGDAVLEFERVIDFLASSKNHTDASKLVAAEIYHAYSRSQIDESNAKHAAKTLVKIAQQTTDETQKMEALYYLGLCYETIGDKEKAKESYKQIQNIKPVYRDVDIRYLVLGK